MKTSILPLFAAAALSVSAQDYVNVGNPGNASDPVTGFGAVATTFGISRYEVTNGQYANFLNAVAASDPDSLYNPEMDTNVHGGITQLGLSGEFTYITKPGFLDKPVVFVSFFDAMRYANWLHNGQGLGGTETGAYTLSLGGLAPREAGAQFWIPSENEWYKAAYHQPAGSGGDVDNYWLYPTGTNTAPNSRNGSLTDPNSGNFYRDDGFANGFNDGYAATGSPTFDSGQNYLLDVGAFEVADSYYGTLDQAGNVFEWNDTVLSLARGYRGGAWIEGEGHARADTYAFNDPAIENNIIGFRVATVPEPSMAILLLSGTALCFRRRSFRTNERNA